MRIAFFTESYAPYISGVTRSVELLAKELSAFGHEVTVFCPSYPGCKDSGPPNIKRLPSIPITNYGFRIAVPLPGFIGKQAFDILHSHSPAFLGIAALRYARKNRVPIVYTFHTLFEEYLHYVPLPRMFGRAFIRAYLRHFCSLCDVVTAPNELSAKYLKELGVSRNIELISSGINCSLSSNASRNKVHEMLPENRLVLLYVGRLSKEKNLYFLQAFKKIASTVPETLLLLVGDGPEKKTLETTAKNIGLDKKIIFAGMVPYPSVLDYYKCADVFVFPSKTETQGLVIAEAKSCGLPAVAVDAGGVSSSICNGQDGFLTRDDVGEFADKVILLLKNPSLRRDFCKNALQNAFRDFSSVNIAKHFEKVYNSVLIHR